jgi:tRNA (guanine-N7-)-methyltransferase
MSARHVDARAKLWPAYGLTVMDGDRSALDLGELFGRDAPRVLEIGFGMGDTTAAMAAADRERDYLAVEVHTPGIGNLLALVGELGLTNVRVAHGDAMELVHRIEPAALDAVHVFFPDPWPKARHHKRRLIQPANVVLLRQLLRPGGVLHCATDWPDYAEAMAATLDADPGLRRIYEQEHDLTAPADDIAGHVPATQPADHITGLRPARQPADDTAELRPAIRPTDEVAGLRPGTRSAGDVAGARPVTKFERRGTLAGRPIADLRYCRRGDHDRL